MPKKFEYKFDGFTIISDKPDLKSTQILDWHYDSDLEEEVSSYEIVYPISCREILSEEDLKNQFIEHKESK